jgi:hypothetical protein
MHGTVVGESDQHCTLVLHLTRARLQIDWCSAVLVLLITLISLLNFFWAFERDRP